MALLIGPQIGNGLGHLWGSLASICGVRPYAIGAASRHLAAERACPRTILGSLPRASATKISVTSGWTLQAAEEPVSAATSTRSRVQSQSSISPPDCLLWASSASPSRLTQTPWVVSMAKARRTWVPGTCRAAFSAELLSWSSTSSAIHLCGAAFPTCITVLRREAAVCRDKPLYFAVLSQVLAELVHSALLPT